MKGPDLEVSEDGGETWPMYVIGEWSAPWMLDEIRSDPDLWIAMLSRLIDGGSVGAGGGALCRARRG